MSVQETSSLKRKLAWITILSTSLTLLLAGGSFLVYELITFRQSMVRNLSTDAQIVAYNTAAAVVFNDAHAATETLAAMRVEPHIMSIRIYTPDGHLFASYLRTGLGTPPALPATTRKGAPGYFFTSDQLALSQHILSEGAPIATVFIQSDLGEIRDRVIRYAGIELVLLFFSLLFGSLISSRLQRKISQPILDLVAVVRKISFEKNYSLRVESRSKDELGRLATSVNEMLGEIERQNSDLRRAHDTLEKRVEERTQALKEEVTERKRLEDQLRRKNEELEAQNQRVQEATRLKSEFLANMSHELRTPLNAIIGFSEVMYDGRVGPIADQHKEFLGDILTSSRHLLQLINDVLDLSKIEAGKMEFRPETVNLDKIVGEVRDILRTLAAKKRVRIFVEVAPNVVDIVVDPSKLKQVLYNYLSNAIKFTPDDGTITVRAFADGADAFCIEVADTGIGIAQEDLGRLFKEFEQLDSTTAKKYPGTGLGLALTRRILLAQGGTYRVRSELGKGSVFSAVLPRIAKTDRVPSSPIVTASDKPTILVVDDEAKDRDYICEVLNQAGYAVQVAATGQEALQRVKERRFDAITLDLLLPDVSGLDILRAIRREGLNQDVAVIVVTVISEKGVGVGLAIHDFLIKPFAGGELLTSLDRAHLDRTPNKGRILIVDDDVGSQKLMELTLRDLGYATLCESNGASGLKAVLEHRPVAIVLDLMMPGMDGFVFLARLREMEAGKKIPVIIWTNKDLSHDERVGLMSNAEAVLLKGQMGTQALLRELQSYLPRQIMASAATNALPAHGQQEESHGR